jgi:hypothetical protein
LVCGLVVVMLLRFLSDGSVGVAVAARLPAPCPQLHVTGVNYGDVFKHLKRFSTPRPRG